MTGVGVINLLFGHTVCRLMGCDKEFVRMSMLCFIDIGFAFFRPLLMFQKTIIFPKNIIFLVVCERKKFLHLLEYFFYRAEHGQWQLP
jgi:hypothetical protein